MPRQTPVKKPAAPKATKSAPRGAKPAQNKAPDVAPTSAKKPAKPKNKGSASPPAGVLPGAVVSFDSHEAYRHFAELARGHEPASFKGDGSLVLTNAQAALDAISPHLGRAGEVGVEQSAIEEIPSIARALQFAALQVIDREVSTREISEKLQALRPLRALVLKSAELLADPLVKLAPRDRVVAIRAGSGPIDLAQDAVALRALFRDLGAAVVGKHPVTAEQLEQLGNGGEWLLSRLRRGNAPAKKSLGPSPEAETRDRIWSLLQSRHDQLWLVGSKVWGPRHVGEHIPPLLSRQAAARTTPTPAVTPAPAAKD